MADSDERFDKTFAFATPMPEPDVPTVGREEEIEMALDTLYKTRMRNLIVVGKAGVGKTHLVREVARRAIGHTFYEISTAALVAGQHRVGDFEERMQKFLNQARAEQRRRETKVVLFFDEVHTMVGAGSTQAFRYELDMAQILKPTLSRGDIAIWGATTKEEYEESIGVDKALARRFDLIELKPLEEDDVLETLRRFAKGEASEETLRRILDESEPDNLDEAISKLDRFLAHRRRLASKLYQVLDETPADAIATTLTKKPSTAAIENALRRKGAKK